jgi:hypothetical protein
MFYLKSQINESLNKFSRWLWCSFAKWIDCDVWRQRETTASGLFREPLGHTQSKYPVRSRTLDFLSWMGAIVGQWEFVKSGELRSRVRSHRPTILDEWLARKHSTHSKAKIGLCMAGQYQYRRYLPSMERELETVWLNWHIVNKSIWYPLTFSQSLSLASDLLKGGTDVEEYTSFSLWNSRWTLHSVCYFEIPVLNGSQVLSSLRPNRHSESISIDSWRLNDWTFVALVRATGKSENRFDYQP